MQEVFTCELGNDMQDLLRLAGEGKFCASFGTDRIVGTNLAEVQRIAQTKYPHCIVTKYGIPPGFAISLNPLTGAAHVFRADEPQRMVTIHAAHFDVDTMIRTYNELHEKEKGGCCEMSDGQTILNEKDPLFKKSILRLVHTKQKRGTLGDTRETHTCDPQFCQPECERMICDPPYIASNVFVCRLGSIHLCSVDTCLLYSLDAHNTCPISGFQMGQEVSSYSKDDYRTWRNPKAEKQSVGMSPGGGTNAQWLLSGNVVEEEEISITKRTFAVPKVPEKRKRRKRMYSQQMSDEDAKTAASAMVKLLLYSRNRHVCIEKAMARYRQQGDDAKNTYVKTQREMGQLPYVADMYRLMAHYRNQPLPMKEFEFNEITHNYYTFIITQVWDIVQRFHVPLNQKRYEGEVEMVPRLDFTAIALGTMYLMRKGVQRNQVELLPADDFLLMNLPGINLLSDFGIEKSLVTKGDKIISEAYDNAFAEGVAMSEVLLEMEKLPRPQSTVITQERGLLVKISSSGEKLFMPQSRKSTSK